ncbi:MAG TPA: hypothetical protein VEA99_19160 [Gemmatimonadaceae bacterium]|nr:hypothetical protein [Gemmatimonadaceae bacterium]
MTESAPDTRPDGTPEHPDDMSEEAVRDRIVRLAFAGDHERYASFVEALREVVPPGVQVVLRGSAVTGMRWADGQPFDADGPGTSDLDLTLVGGGMPKLFNEYYIPGLHSVPLSESYPEASHVFQPLRRALCTLTGREVNIQATTDLLQQVRDLLLDQPYFVLVKEGEGRGPSPDEEREEAAAETPEDAV